MAFVTAALMLANSPQTFFGLTSTQNSFLPVVDILALYGRHVSNEVRQKLMRLPVDAGGPKTITTRAGRCFPYLRLPTAEASGAESAT
jgi:hypothetical protein